MTELVRAVLQDFREHGAEAPFLLAARVHQPVVDDLLARRYLVCLPETPAGALVVLGPEGRAALGLSPGYRSPPEVAADQYVRRRCVRLLQDRGWAYRGKVDGFRHLLCLHKQAQCAYLLARWRRCPAASVRGVMRRLGGRLIGSKSVLLVHTDRPHDLRYLLAQNPGLIRLFAEEAYRYEDQRVA